jgi:hypothetical protein
MKADSSNSPTRSSARASAARKAVHACESRLTTAERTGDRSELRTLHAAA